MKTPMLILLISVVTLIIVMPFLDREHAKNIKVQSNVLREADGLRAAVHDQENALKTAILLAGVLGFEQGRGYELGRTNCACSNLLAQLRLSYHITNAVPELDWIYGR